MRRLLLLLLIVPLLALPACGGDANAGADGPAVTSISGPMPSLSGKTLQGSTLERDAYAGRIVVVNFWATWCGPCRREQPILSAEQAASGPDGPFFVGVNYRDDSAAARAYLEEFHVRYPSLEDPSGSLAYRFGVPGLPSTILVDAQGRMRFRVVGALTASELSDLIHRIEM